MEVCLSTLGHIDHGKSSLVQALTGQDPDRWAEEKKRGITLDLGFASLSYEGKEVSIIDVPGHEDLIHNMLAGIGGLTGVILVVAADEGVMPQTKEHFQIARLLGVPQGIIALTRCDLADAESLQVTKEEVLDLVEGSFLAQAPLIVCSAKTGEGLKDLKKAITRLAPLHQTQTQGLPFRLPIDRGFLIKGFGKVVTGTVCRGALTTSSPCVLYPGQKQVKLRGLQSRNQAVEQVVTGMRAAINLSRAPSNTPRGCQLASPNSLSESRDLDIWLEWLPQTRFRPKDQASLTLFSHAQESPARLIAPKGYDFNLLEPGFFRLRLEKTLAFAWGDRLILRAFNPKETLAGAIVVLAKKPLTRISGAKRNEALHKLQQGSAEERIEAIALFDGLKGIEEKDLFPLTGLTPKKAAKPLQHLASQGKLLRFKTSWRHPEHLQRIIPYITQLLQQFHQAQPEEIGATGEYFTGKLKRLFSAAESLLFLSWLEKEKILVKTAQFYHLQGVTGALSPEQVLLKQSLLLKLKQGGMKPQSPTTLQRGLTIGLSGVTRLLALGKTRGWWVELATDQFLSTAATDKAWQELKTYLSKEPQITVIGFKKLLDLSRKEAVLILEYFDREKRTIRLGDHRILARESEKNNAAAD